MMGWDLLCALQLDAVLKHLSQVLHLSGYSPEWYLKFSFKSCFVTKHLPQVLHLYGLSPE